MVATNAVNSGRNKQLNFRISDAQQQLIDRAAHILGKNRSEFVLEASLHEAQDVLLNQTFFALDEERFDRFTALLEAPPQPTEELRAFLATPAPWE